MRRLNYKTSEKGQVLFLISIFLYALASALELNIFNLEITGLNIGRARSQTDVLIVGVWVFLGYLFQKIDGFSEKRGDAIALSMLVIILFGYVYFGLKTYVL